MDTTASPFNLGRITNRLALYQQQISPSPHPQSKPASTSHTTKQPKMAARDPITCHCLNTLSGTPAANLPVTLTLLDPSATSNPTFRATTNADGRVAMSLYHLHHLGCENSKVMSHLCPINLKIA
jgi:5-hydroxyisourate hydrolase